MPTVEGHTVGRVFTCWPERRPASAGVAQKTPSHAEIRRHFNRMEGGGWPHSAGPWSLRIYRIICASAPATLTLTIIYMNLYSYMCMRTDPGLTSVFTQSFTLFEAVRVSRLCRAVLLHRRPAAARPLQPPRRCRHRAARESEAQVRPRQTTRSLARGDVTLGAGLPPCACPRLFSRLQLASFLRLPCLKMVELSRLCTNLTRLA